jgi:PP-loop superfamily ATP-utilizing enzyme
MKNKTTYVLWSGGLDSTYLIQYLLEKNPKQVVRAGYIELVNNVYKTKMETAAIVRCCLY